MHALNFHYSLTRSYNYLWYPWVVFFGGICATLVLTVINLAANGYELHNVYVSDPNATLSNPAWYEKRPWSWTSKVSPICQAQTISQGSQIFTNNHALQYKIGGLLTKDGEHIYSLAYLNHDIQNCTIDGLLTTWPKFNVTMTGVQVEVNCLLNIQQQGTVHVSLVPLLDVEWVPLILSKSPSIAFGATMVTGYFDDLLPGHAKGVPILPYGWNFPFPLKGSDLWGIYHGITPDGNVSRKHGIVGTMHFVKEIMDGVEVAIEADSLADWNSVFGLDMIAKDMVTVLYGEAEDQHNISDPYASATIRIDGFVKAIRSTILSDLGCNDDTNIFASPEKSLDFMNKTVQMVSGQDWENASNWERLFYPHDQPNPTSTPPTDVTAFYEWANMSLPHVQTTQFSMQYLCQVPKLKSAGSLFISVAVADFVFLQVIWTIFNWIMTYFLERKHPNARYCVGCAKAVALGQLDLDDKPRPSSEEKDRCSSRYSESAEGPLVWSDTISVTSDATGGQSPSILRRRTDVNPYLAVPNG